MSAGKAEKQALRARVGGGQERDGEGAARGRVDRAAGTGSGQRAGAGGREAERLWVAKQDTPSQVCRPPCAIPRAAPLFYLVNAL